MKYSIPKERILRPSHDDEGCDIAAGTPALEPGFGSRSLGVVSREVETAEQCAFSSLVQLLRRAEGLSIEQLAERARVDAGELVSIESDVRHQPRPRTVHQLAQFFNLPEKGLLQLSNLTSVETPELRQAAVRFAANARNVMELTREERQALNEFVSFLGSR